MPMSRHRNAWIVVIALTLQVIGFLMFTRTAGLVLMFLGLGLSFLSLKLHYDKSEPKTNHYQLIPKTGK
jgi:hypothetical protein